MTIPDKPSERIFVAIPLLVIVSQGNHMSQTRPSFLQWLLFRNLQSPKGCLPFGQYLRLLNSEKKQLFGGVLVRSAPGFDKPSRM